MDYQVFDLVRPYLHESHHIFASLVCKDWLNIIKIINKKKYSTPYNVLTSVALLSYADTYLNLVYNETVKEEIIKIGNLESIKYVHTKADIINTKYLNFAVQNGLLDQMKWLQGFGCEFDYFTFLLAVRNGNLENMKWLQSNGCEFYSGTFAYAAQNGNLDNMKWLRANGCEYDWGTINDALFNGNQENIKWLRANGCGG